MPDSSLAQLNFKLHENVEMYLKLFIRKRLVKCLCRGLREGAEEAGCGLKLFFRSSRCFCCLDFLGRVSEAGPSKDIN